MRAKIIAGLVATTHVFTFIAAIALDTKRNRPNRQAIKLVVILFLLNRLNAHGCMFSGA